MIRKIVALVVSVVLVVSIVIPICDSIDDSSSNVLDVIVIDGQSNGAQTIDGALPESVDPTKVTGQIPLLKNKLYYYGTSEHPAVYGTNPSNPSYDTTFQSYSIHNMVKGNQYIIGGIEPSLAYYLSQKTGNDVLVLNVAVGASPISWHIPTATGGIWTNDYLTHAFAEISGYSKINRLGWVWLQGEADRNNSVEGYIEDFDKIKAYYDEIGFNECVIVNNRDAWGGNSIIAQERIVEGDPNVRFAPIDTNTFTIENGLLRHDGLHYTQFARNLIGESVASMFDSNDYSQSVKAIVNILPSLILVGILVGFAGSIFYDRFIRV